jgi:hypothetical protein
VITDLVESSIFATGMARLDAELRLKARCMFSSAKAERAKVASIVTSRAPRSLTESTLGWMTG